MSNRFFVNWVCYKYCTDFIWIRLL